MEETKHSPCAPNQSHLTTVGRPPRLMGDIDRSTCSNQVTDLLQFEGRSHESEAHSRGTTFSEQTKGIHNKGDLILTEINVYTIRPVYIEREEGEREGEMGKKIKDGEREREIKRLFTFGS